MNASYVSSVYFDIAPVQFKLNQDERWLLQNPEYMAQQISKDLKNESNSKLRRHTINIKTDPSSTPKIISVERKMCSDTCEKTCIRNRRSITEAVILPSQVSMEMECEDSNSKDPNLKPDVKSKINFFNQIASENGRFPKAIPRRRISIRNEVSKQLFQNPKSECQSHVFGMMSSIKNEVSKPLFQSPKPECQSHVFGKDVRVFKISSDDLAAVKNVVQQRNRDCGVPHYRTVQQNKQKFDHCLGSSFSEEKKIKRHSTAVELPITAVPVRLRIAEIEKKCVN